MTREISTLPKIEKFSAAQITANRAELIALLQNVVNGGASVSFLAPLDVETAAAYWDKVARQAEDGERIVLATRANSPNNPNSADNPIVGSAQLALAAQPNARHRAEVQKVLVHSAHRLQGIGQALMLAIEQAARENNRTLLVLDTVEGAAAERLYEKQGYTRAGIIPNFAMSSAGTLEPTVIFYRLI